MMPFQFNDGGRAAAGFRGSVGDCVTRAICIAASLPYAEVYADMAGIKANERRTKRSSSASGRRTAAHGIHTKRKAFRDWMAARGWVWTPTMGIGSGCRVHLRAGELPAGRIIVQVSKHYAAVIDGVLHDTHDCSRGGGRCVYGYWSQGGAA